MSSIPYKDYLYQIASATNSIPSKHQHKLSTTVFIKKRCELSIANKAASLTVCQILHTSFLQRFKTITLNIIYFEALTRPFQNDKIRDVIRRGNA